MCLPGQSGCLGYKGLLPCKGHSNTFLEISFAIYGYDGLSVAWDDDFKIPPMDPLDALVEARLIQADIGQCPARSLVVCSYQATKSPTKYYLTYITYTCM